MSNFVQNPTVASNYQTAVNTLLQSPTLTIGTEQDWGMSNSSQAVPVQPIIDVTPSSVTTKNFNLSQVGGQNVAVTNKAGEISIGIDSYWDGASWSNFGLKTPFAAGGSTQSIKMITNSSGKGGTSLTAGTGALLYTVTASKTLYVNSIQIGAGAGSSAGNSYELRDGTTIAGGLVTSGTLACSTTAQSQQFSVTFPTPLKFVNGIFMDVGTTAGFYWTIVGWEQ